MNLARLGAAAFAAFLALPLLAFGEGTTLSEGDNQCLGCHGQPGLTKAFDKGPTLDLHVDAAAFAGSVHAPLGCATCHADVDLKKHPGASRKFATARAFSDAGVETCKGCHASIFEAFSQSIHVSQKTAASPICADCHSAHRVVRASVGTHIRDTCIGCHADALAKHKAWLPNTQRHLESVACAACHAPGAEKRIDLRLYDASAKTEAAGRETGAVEGKPVDERVLRDILKTANTGEGGKVTLVGRLEPSTPEQSHGLARKEDALKDCAGCHRKGAAPFRNVTLSVVGPDGKRVHYEAASEVLHGPTSIDSMRAFYAPGGTRVEALDILLGLALLGGVSAPLGHLVMRKLVRRKEKQ
jgi:hypothetical protein